MTSLYFSTLLVHTSSPIATYRNKQIVVSFESPADVTNGSPLLLHLNVAEFLTVAELSLWG